MTAGILIALLTGYLLRGFRVWILLPIVTAATAGIFVLQLMAGAGGAAAIGTALLAGIALQAGYAIGLAIRVGVSPLPARGLRKSLPPRSPLLDP